MRLSIAAATIALSLLIGPGFVPAHAQANSTEPRLNKCGLYKSVCRSARAAHEAAGYNVSPLWYCGGPTAGCHLPNSYRGWFYRYMR